MAVATGAAVLLVPTVAVDGLVGPYVDPKAWLLVMLGGSAGVAWVLTHSQSPEDPRLDRMAQSLRLTVLAYLAWQVLTTATSIAPGLSIWGEWSRAQGLVTIAATVVFGAMVWGCQRTSMGVVALVDLALLGSLPVCLLALGQAGGWSPLPQTQRDPATAALQVRSTLGLHIFLGSYLGLLVPLTLARLAWRPRETPPGRTVGAAPLRLLAGLGWTAGVVGIAALAAAWPPAAWGVVPLGFITAMVWTRASGPGPEVLPPGIVTGCLAGLLALQVLVALLTRARGPFLGLLVGLSVSGIGLLAARRAWAALGAATFALAGTVLLLGMLNWPASPLAPLRDVPALSRYARLTEARPGSPGWVRLQVWRGVLAGWSRQIAGEPILPGTSAMLRSLVGYGPETQATPLEPLTRPRLGLGRTAAGDRWIRYFIDRAHNDPLDHLLGGGIGAAVLWLAVVATLFVVGGARIARSSSGTERALRLGALGAVAGHLVETQFGIATPTSRLLLGVAAGLLTMPSSREAPAPNPPVGPHRPGRSRGLVLACVVAGLAGAGSTGWLLASAAYTGGSRAWAAGEAGAAYRSFMWARTLAPWLARPAEASAEVALSLASREADPRRRVELLHEAQALLTAARGAARPNADHWALVGQIAYAQGMAGVPSSLGTAVNAYTEAARLRPGDGQVQALRALALLDAGDPVAARDAADRAIQLDSTGWLPWAVLARSARDLGDPARAHEAAVRARALAPSGAQALLHRLVP